MMIAAQLTFPDESSRAYLTERDEPFYGPDVEKKTGFSPDLLR